MSDSAQTNRLARELEGRRLPPPDLRAAIRRAVGVTQAAVADEVGVHPVTVARWEAGTREPRGGIRSRYLVVLDRLQRELAP